LEEGLRKILPLMGEIGGGKIQDTDGRRRVSQDLLQFPGIPGSERGKRRALNFRIAILGEEGEDFNFFFDRNREFSCRPLPPDNTGRRPVTECVDNSSWNSLLLRG